MLDRCIFLDSGIVLTLLVCAPDSLPLSPEIPKIVCTSHVAVYAIGQ